MNASRTRLVIGIAAVSALGLSACVANNPSSTSASGSAGASDAPLSVTITDDTCKVSAASVPSGVVNFKLTNNGTVRNEFEILAEDKLRIVGERENLGPGTSVDYTVTLQPGKYFTACKKNMVGALVGATEFTVTDSGKPVEVSSDEKAQIDAAVTNYTAYVRDQSGQLLEQTKSFAELYKKGDFDSARKAYAPARMYYERIEPTAEAFGDIDPALDQREADWQEEGADGEWTGWHAIEKDLWRPDGYQGLNEDQRSKMADKLVEDTQKLYDLVYSDNFKISLSDIPTARSRCLKRLPPRRSPVKKKPSLTLICMTSLQTSKAPRLHTARLKILRRQRTPSWQERSPMPSPSFSTSSISTRTATVTSLTTPSTKLAARLFPTRSTRCAFPWLS